MKTTPILKFMRAHYGYARTMELLSLGLAFRDIEKLLQDQQIEKVKRGLYRLTGKDYTANRDLVDICRSIPQAVVCLYSALSHYGLTTFMPTEVMIAIPQGYHAPKMTYPPTRVFHFSRKQYEAGIKAVKTKEGVFKIYNEEKSVCDAFRFRRKLGDDTAKEALFTYLKENNSDLKKLLDYAHICRVANVMKPYIEARIEP